MTLENLVIIDNNIQDFQTIIEALNSNTKYILFDGFTDTYDTMKNKIIELTISTFASIGIIQHNLGGGTYSLFRNADTNDVQASTLANVEVEDPDLNSWSEYREFITYLNNEYSMVNFDLMACALYSDPNWKYVIDTLETQTGVEIRASYDNTGASALGGNWFLETHGVNLKDVYFTDAIDDFRGVLIYSFHNVLIKSDGTIYSAGNNNYGQIGDGTTTTRNTFTLMPNSTGKKIKMISQGHYHNVVLMSDGSMYGTGTGQNGQLGANGTWNTISLSLVTNSTGKIPSIVRCGSYYSVVFMTDGTIYSTGYNYHGQFGDGTTTDKGTLTLMPNNTGKTVKDIFTSGEFTIVLMTDGTIYGTGQNATGNLGVGDNSNKTTLTQMINNTGKTPKSVSCGGSHIVVLMTDGTIYCTGWNFYGQLGDGTLNQKNTLTLMTIPSGKTPSSVSCGSAHTLVIMTDGTIYGTGYNNNGQLGDNTTTSKSSLTLMTNSTGKTPKNILGNYNSTLVLMTDGSLYVTGYNGQGELGLGDTVERYLLTSVSGTYSTLVNTEFEQLTPNFVSVGYGTNSISYSFDGISWTGIGTSIFSSEGINVGYSAKLERWVAVGYGTNTIAYSNNGINWTGLGNIIFASQGNGAVYSESLSLWVAFGGNYGSNTMAYSTDGISWTGLGASIFSVHGTSAAYSEKLQRWVAVGNGTNSIAHSTNGITWTGLGTSIFSGSGTGIAYSSELSRWVATGEGINSIAYSTDGINWTGLGTSIFSNFGLKVTYSSALSRWVAVGKGTNSIAYSYDGISWTGIGTSIFTTDARAITYSDISGTWVAGGSGTNSIAHSRDGINWTGLGAIAHTNYSYAVASKKVIIANFVSVGNGINSIAYSSNGINWTGVGNSIFTVSGYNASFSPVLSRWVAVGEGTNTIAHSNDGVNWTGLGTSIFSINAWNVAYSRQLLRWVAVGGGTNSIAFSTDGITWTGIGTSIFSVAGYGVWYSEEQNRWVAVGEGTSNSIAYSTDGISWTGVGKSIFSTWAISVVYSIQLSRWVAVGSGTNTIAYSADGISWTGIGTSIFSIRGHGLGYSEQLSRWVALGQGGRTIAYSTDGISWTGTGGSATSIQNYTGSEGIITKYDKTFYNFTAPTDLTITGLTINASGGLNNGGYVVIEVELSGVGQIYRTAYGIGSIVDTVVDINSWTTRAMTAGQQLSVAWTTLAGDRYFQMRQISGNALPTIFSYSVNTIFSTGGYDVTYNNELSRWVAVGQGTNTIAHSVDGISWTGLGTSIFSIISRGVGSRTLFTPTLTMANIVKNANDAPFNLLQPTSNSIGNIANTYTNFYIRTGGSDWQTRIINNDTSNTNIQYWGYDNQWWYDHGPPNYIAQQFRFFAAYVCAYYHITSGSASVYHGSGYLGPYSFTYNGGTSYTATYTGSSYNEGPQTWNYSLPVTVNSKAVFLTSSGIFNHLINNTSIASTSLLYSNNNITSRTSTTNFPTLNTLSVWEIHICFTLTGGSSWRPLIGSMYNNVDTGRGWGVWISATNAIHYSNNNSTFDSFTGSILQNEPYIIKVRRNTNSYNFRLIRVSTQVVLSDSHLILDPMGTGPVEIYGFSNGETFVGTIHYVKVLNPFKVTISNGGSTTITATQEPEGVFKMVSISPTLTVNLSNPTLSNFTIPAKNFGDAAFSVTAPTSNNPDGTFTFSSNNTSVATINADIIRNALNFDGVNDTVVLNRFPTFTSSNQITIEGWYYFTNYSVNIVTLNNNSGFGIDAQGRPNASLAFSGSGWFYLVSDTVVPLNTWVYIAMVTNDNGYHKIYINNSIVKNVANTSSGAFTTCIGLSLAANAQAGVEYSRFSVSEFRIWDIARTETQIRNNYFREVLGNSSGLRVYFKFNQGTANGNNSGLTSLLEYTSDGFAGTLTNFALSGSTSNWVAGPTLRPITDINIVGAGSSTITATQAASGNYTSGSTNTTLTVNAIAPTFNTFSAITKNFNDTAFTVSATSNSGGAITYDSSNTSVATISGTTVTIVGAGVTTITANQAASGNYTSGSTNTTLTVNTIAPTFNTFSAITKNFNDSAFTVSATSNSGGAITYISSNTSVATISGTTVTIVGAGVTTITANQAASGNYTSGSTNTTLTVNTIAPTITNFNMPAKYFGYPSFSIITKSHIDLYIRTGGSDWQTRIINNDTSYTNIQYWGPDGQWYESFDAANQIAQQFRFYAAYVTTYYNITSGSASVLLGNGNTGTYSFTYNGGTSYTGSFTGYNVGAQTWNYTLPVTVYSNTLVPTSNSTGSFTYISSNHSVATISGNSIIIVGGGSTTITANQAAAGNYSTGSTTALLTVSPISPTFSWTNITKNFGDAQFTISASSNSSGAIAYSSNNTAVATIIGTTVTIVGAGSSTISAIQDATNNYSSAGGGIILTVNAIAPSLSNFSIATKNFGDAAFNLTSPTSNSGGSFSYSSNNSSVATISGSTITIIGAGSSTITATQASTTNYTSGTINATFTVNPIAPSLSNFSALTKNFGDAPFTVTATSNSDGSFSYSSNNSAVATISGSTVTIVGAGSSTITATQGSTTNYTSGTITTTFTVNPVAAIFNTFSNIVKTFGDAAFRVTATSSNSVGAITYSSNNGSVASISDTNLVTLIGIGTATITATIAATTNHLSGTTSMTLTVNTNVPTIGPLVVYTNRTTLNLLAHYDASHPSFYTLSSGSVTQWNDLSGNGYHLTNYGTGPTITNINSISAFDFNSERGLIRSSVPLTTSITFLIVVKYSTNIETYGNFIHHGDRDYDWSLERDISSSNVIFQSNGINNAAITAVNNVNYIWVGRIVGNTRQFWAYSDTLATSSVSGTGVSISSGSKTLYVGRSDIGETCNSSIGEILYYNASLSDADLERNVNYLRMKWFNPNTTVVKYGDSSFAIPEPISNSAGAFTYSSSNTSVASLSGNTVTIVGAGSTTIIATQAGSGNYLSGSVNATLSVAKAIPTFSTFSNITKSYTDAAFRVTATTIASNSPGQFSYLIANPAIATISDTNLFTIQSAGNTTVTARIAETSNYLTAYTTATLAVNPSNPTIGSLTLPSKTFGDSPFTITNPTSNSTQIFGYTSSNTNVATISNLLYTISNPSIPLLSLTNFPTIGSISNWEMNIRFNTTGGANTWRALIGDMYNNINTSSGWGIWVSNLNSLHFSWTNQTWEAASLSVSLNTDYILKTTRGLRNINISSATNLSSPPSNMHTLYNSISYVNTIFSMTITGSDASAGAVWGTDVYTSDSIIAKAAVHAGVLSPNETKLVYIEILSPIATYQGSTRNGITTTLFSNSAFAYYSYRFITTSIATSLSLTFSLTNVSTGISQTAINTAISDTSAYVMSTNGPVTIGGWINNSGENFNGTISYVNVSNLGVSSVNIVGAGSATITANQDATSNFNSGSVSNTLSVARATTTISSITLPIKKVGDPQFSFSASTSNNTETAIVYSSSNTSVATVSGTTITIVGGGLSTISASQVQTANYTSGTISTTFIVIGLDAEYPSVNLYGANLAYSNFFSANFTNANLATANLYYANLFDCDMVNADLSGTNLEGVISGNIRGTPTLPTDYRMINGYIIGPQVSLQNANLVSQSITNANLFMANLTNSRLINSDFTNTIMTSADLTNANIYGTNVTSTNLTLATLNGIISGQITGSPSSLPTNYTLNQGYLIGPYVNVSSSIFTNGSIINANLFGANINNSSLISTNFSGTNLTNTTFLATNLTDVNLTNTNVSNSQLGTAILNGVISSGIVGTPASLPSNYSTISGYIIGPYVNLSSTNLGSINITNSNIFGANLSNAVVSSATLNGVISGSVIGIPTSLPTNYNLITGYIVGPYVNLTNANVYNSNFTNANILGAIVNNINLSNATLNGLISGQLSGSPFALPVNYITVSGYFIGPSVNLTNASLTGADLTNANIYGATITSASMSGTNLIGLVSGALIGLPSSLPSDYSTISGYIIGPRVNLTNANLITSNLTNSNIFGATVTNAILLNSTLNGLISGSLSGVPLSLPANYTPISGYIVGPFVNLTSAVLTTSNFTNSNIYGATITNASMSNTNLYGLISGQLVGTPLSLTTEYSVNTGYIIGPSVNLTNAGLANSNLTNANINGAIITNVNLSNATLNGIISGGLIGSTTLITSNYNVIDGFIIGPRVNLTNASLINSNLQNQNIFGATITNTNLSNAILNGLSSGELIGNPASLPTPYSKIDGYIVGPYVNLSSALLTNTNLTNSNIYGVSLQNAVMTNADLTGVISGAIVGIPNSLPANYTTIDGYIIGPRVNLTDAVLSTSNLTNANIYAATVTNANFSSAVLNNIISGAINGLTNKLPLDYSIISGYIIGPKVNLTSATLTNANLTNSNIHGATITNSDIIGAVLNNVSSGELIGSTSSLPVNYQIQLGYLIGPYVNLTNAVLSTANLVNANIFGANLTNSNLLSANLTSANIMSSTISDIHLTNAKLNNIFTGDIIGETTYLPQYYEINTGYILGPFVNLNSADLSSSDLTNSNIYGCNLNGVNLSNAILDNLVSGQNTNSSGIALPTNYKMISDYLVGPSVNLTGADLINSNLTNANLFNANITNTNFSNSIFNALISGNITTSPLQLPNQYSIKLGYIVGPFVSLISANLQNANLTNANIIGIDITGSDFSNVNFNGVSSGSIIGNAASITTNYSIINGYIIGPNVNLFNSNLNSADLTNSKLNNANMRNSNLAYSTLTNTDLQSADLYNVRSGGITGTPLFPTSFTIVNGYLIGPYVNLSGANLTGANLTNTTLTNANITNTNLSSAIIINANLDGAILINANIFGANLNNTTFVNSNLNGADLNSAIVTNTNFTNTDITGADISNISFTNVQKLQQQKNINNRDIAEIQITSVPSQDILSQISEEIIEDLPDLSQTPINVLVPVNGVVNVSSVSGGAFYIPSSNNEQLIIGNRTFTSNGNEIRDTITNEVVTCLRINNKLFKLIPGSLIGIEVDIDELYQLNGLGLNTILDANNNNSKWINNYGNIYTNYTNIGVGIINPSYKIHTSGQVGATGYVTTSDQRLKSNVHTIDDNSALNIVRQLSPKTYEYIDKVNNKSDTVYGFIAQEVSQVLPYSVDTISNFIPNLYTNIIIGDSVAYCLDKDIEFIVKDPNSVIYIKIYKDANEIICRLGNIINKRTFTIIEQLQDGPYLLYGQMVDDFQTLKKDAIFTVSVAALQEIDKIQCNIISQLSNVKQENDEFINRLTYLENIIGNLINK